MNLLSTTPADTPAAERVGGLTFEDKGSGTAVEALYGNRRTIVKNEILAGLSLDDFAAISPWLEPVSLQPRMILKESKRPINYVYFVEAGLVSIRIANGGCIFETAIVGRECAVGLSSLIGVDIPTHQFVSVLSGRAFRIQIDELRRLSSERPRVKDRLAGYIVAQQVHNAQMGLCGARHDLEKRVACWLCLACDALGDPVLAVTQDYLSNALGLRRPGVNKALSCFEEKLLIRKERGVLHVIDRGGLRHRSCGCCDIIAGAYRYAEAVA